MHDTEQRTAEFPAVIIENRELRQQLADVQEQCVELAVMRASFMLRMRTYGYASLRPSGIAIAGVLRLNNASLGDPQAGSREAGLIITGQRNELSLLSHHADRRHR